MTRYFVQNNANSEKLLIVVSDGRGIFSKGRANVAETIKRARAKGIFIILIIIDNPLSEKSITDIKVRNSYTFLCVFFNESVTYSPHRLLMEK